MKCFKTLRCQVLSFEAFSYLLSFNLSRCCLLFLVSTSLARLVLSPFSCRIYTPLFWPLLCFQAACPETPRSQQRECCSWELSSAKQGRIIAFPVLHTVVLLTRRKTTATFFPGAVTLLIPLQLMCLCSIPPQAVSTLLLCVWATASPFPCACVLLSQDTRRTSILKAVAFPTLWRKRKAKFCFPRPPWNDVSPYHQGLIVPGLSADLRNHISVEVNWVGHSKITVSEKRMMKLVTDWISVRHKIQSNSSKLVP